MTTADAKWKECEATTFDQLASAMTRCGLSAGHEGSHDDGCLTWRDPPSVPAAVSEAEESDALRAWEAMQRRWPQGMHSLLMGPRETEAITAALLREAASAAEVARLKRNAATWKALAKRLHADEIHYRHTNALGQKSRVAVSRSAEEVATLTHQRNLLAEAIHEIAVAACAIDAETSLTGPELLHAAKSVAESIVANRTARDRAEAEAASAAQRQAVEAGRIVRHALAVRASRREQGRDTTNDRAYALATFASRGRNLLAVMATRRTAIQEDATATALDLETLAHCVTAEGCEARDAICARMGNLAADLATLAEAEEQLAQLLDSLDGGALSAGKGK